MSGQSAEERDNSDDFKLEESESNEETRNEQYLDTVKTVCWKISAAENSATEFSASK